MAADPQQSASAGQSFAQSAAMQDEMQALARKLLDLWQDHLSALAQDPTLMAQALKLMTAYSPFSWPPQPGTAPTGGTGFAPFPGSFPGPFAAGFPFGGFPAAPAPGQATGAAPTTAAPDAGAGAVGELRRRVAELEGRIAELEQAGAAKPTRKRAARARARAPKGE